MDWLCAQSVSLKPSEFDGIKKRVSKFLLKIVTVYIKVCYCQTTIVKIYSFIVLRDFKIVIIRNIKILIKSPQVSAKGNVELIHD